MEEHKELIMIIFSVSAGIFTLHHKTTASTITTLYFLRYSRFFLFLSCL